MDQGTAHTKKHRHILVNNGSEKSKTGLDLLLGVGSFDNGRNDGEIVVLFADVVRGRNTGDVDVILALDLVLGNDQLDRVAVIGVGDRTLEQADRANDAVGLVDLCGSIGGVANDLRALGNLIARTDTDNLAVLVDDLVHLLVEHVGTTIDSRETMRANKEGRTKTGAMVSQ